MGLEMDFWILNGCAPNCTRGIKVKKKIYLNLVGGAILAILSAMVLITLTYYDIFQKQMFENLTSCAQLIRRYDLLDELDNAGADSLDRTDDLRITLIGTDGQVVLDTQADTGEMENHSGRPEIRKALAEGEGQAVNS